MKNLIMKTVYCFMLTLILVACNTNKTKVDSSLQGDIYINNKLKFQLTFPDKWQNHYLVTYYETEEFDCLKVGFIGNSQWSIYAGDNKPTGLAMFYIATEEAVQKQYLTVNEVSTAGNIGNKKFLFYEPTDYPIGGLMDSGISCSAEEKELRAQDYKIAVEMEKDIIKIMNSFKSLE